MLAEPSIFRMLKMHKYFPLILALSLSSCDSSDMSDIFFIDSAGHGALFFNKEVNQYDYSTIGGKIHFNDEIIQCSNSQMICVKGPFYLKIERDRINYSLTEIVSSDNEKTCTFRLTRDETGDLGIRAFRCEYSNGAPSPEYLAVKVGHNGKMESSTLPFSKL